MTDLLDDLKIPPVIAGGLAVAAHGYQRETDDVDIVIPLTPETSERFLSAAESEGAEIKARHSFGGADLRVPGGRLDVLFLYDPPQLVADAVHEAVHANRTTELFGDTVFVVALSYLIALKLVSERHKDVSDIVELIKVGIEESDWPTARSDIRSVLSKHLGWHGVKRFNDLEAVARSEMGIS